VRRAFVDTLCDLAAANERLLLLTGDLGYMAMEPFQERFGSRFINIGVTEQNMIGLATGLAEAAMIPYAYSIATFAALRPFEFIRNGPVLHQLPVRVVGMGAGFENGTAGSTHHAVEDVGVMRTLPGLTVVIPTSLATGEACVCCKS
jgi:transketolase